MFFGTITMLGEFFFLYKFSILIPANDPVPTEPGPTQLKVELGECNLFLACISVSLR